MEAFLLKLLIFLAAAVIAVPLARKCKLGSVLGYLIAGIVIGPFGLSLIDDIETVMHFTEFGVVMMLFLVGLELKPSLLWQMRTPILGMGGSQVMLTFIAIGLACAYFLPWQQAVAVGLILALSSTAIVLQTLREKGLMNTSPGKSIFSVLLFQDLAVIPMLAIVPLLATAVVHTDAPHHGSGFFDITTLPAHLRLIVVLLAIGLIYAAGKFASRPIFRAIAASRIREVFVAAALALVIGISLLMTAVGLSPALGTFIAGVVLADSEYRHELESDIEPFKGLLLGIFFISIGASLNFNLIYQQLWQIGGLVAGLILIKAMILFAIAMVFKMPGSERLLFALALAQGGEFAFVLFSFARINGVLPQSLTETLISVVAISMFLAPLLFLLHDRLIAPRLQDSGAERPADEIQHGGRSVILAGFGRLGTDLGRLLMSAGIKPVILDHNEANVDILRKFGFEVYYGDVTRLDLLESAGAAEAELIVITIGDHEKSMALVKLVQKHYPHLKIAVNAVDRGAAFEFMDLGVATIRRETFGSALTLGQDALQLLGFDPYEAYKIRRLFRKKDKDTMPELYRIHREDEDKFISMYQQHNANLAELMKKDREIDMEELDKAWTAANPET
ncbi:MAG: monovalent cation:proton antiporter-2 (CPA2) family protein [Desulfobacterales bacterium]|jgi:CPA2 family monovalent cation:H+ antiporter-2/glutathione-regulated potassium-efflux system ancillary protein KefC